MDYFKRSKESLKPLLKDIERILDELRPLNVKPLRVFLVELDDMEFRAKVMTSQELLDWITIRREQRKLLTLRIRITVLEDDYGVISQKIMKCHVFRFLAKKKVMAVHIKLRQVRAELERVQWKIQTAEIRLIANGE